MLEKIVLCSGRLFSLKINMVSYATTLMIKKKKKQKAQKNNNKRKNTTEEQIFKSMTYVPGLSERFKTSDFYNKNKYKIAHKTNNTLRQIFTKTKSKIDTMEKHNIIYEISCTGNTK